MFAFPNSNGSRGKPGTSVPAGRSWRHSRASRPGPATLHTSTNQVATALAHKCDITTLSNYLESNPLIFLGFFSGLGRLGLQAPARPSPSSSSLFSCPIVERSCKHGSLCAAQKNCAVTAITVFRRSCEPAELASRAASNPWKKTALLVQSEQNPWKKTALLGAERTKCLEKTAFLGAERTKSLG